MGWVLNATPKVDAQSEYPTIIAICVVLSVLSTAVVGTRLYIRHSKRGLASDDWMAGLSMVFALLYSGLCIAQTRYGLGLPIALRPKENLVTYTRVNFAGRPIYQLGISFFKIALLISYLRLLAGTDQSKYRLIIWTAIVLVFFAHLGCALSLVFACTPVDRSWNPLKDGTCLPAGPSFTGYAIVTIVSDIIVALLPLPVLWRLEIRLAKKLGLIGIFALGLFTTLCSILRYTQIDRIQSGDGNSTMLILWGTIEFNVGNIVSSLPFLAPVFLKKAKEYRSNKQSGSYDTPSKQRSRSQGFRSDNYKLRDMSGSRDGGVMTSEINHSGNGSEDDILPGGGGIVKSVTYSVSVDREPADGQSQSKG